MGFPDGLTCIVSPTGNRTRDGRHDSAGVGPLHQKFGFWDNFRFIKFPSNIGDLNLGPPAFSATLVTNYTNGITLKTTLLPDVPCWSDTCPSRPTIGLGPSQRTAHIAPSSRDPGTTSPEAHKVSVSPVLEPIVVFSGDYLCDHPIDIFRLPHLKLVSFFTKH